ncbi:MAG: ferrous iron transporter B, partial [Desulfobacteraceae bacterium]
MRVVLVGQPNCGKSALFNSVAGYKAMVGNFPGTTVEYLCSPITLSQKHFTLVDLPGIYSLSSPESEEVTTRRYLLREQPDVIINVLDASVLSRSLELTLELLDLQVPMVVCLNMMDEAGKKGIEIDREHLSQDLGVPVVPTIAVQGQGVSDLFNAALVAAEQRTKGKVFFFSQDIEKPIAELQSLVNKKTAAGLGVSTRLLSLKLLEEDREFEEQALAIQPDLTGPLPSLRKRISDRHGRSAEMVIASERHALAVNLFEHVAKVRARVPKPRREQVDQYVMHPLLGYLILGFILLSLFSLVFVLGQGLEGPLLGLFDKGAQYLNAFLK